MAAVRSAYASKGRHPYSDFMTKEGTVLHNISGMDILIDIAGMYFPLRTIRYDKNINVSDEHGTGSHDPYALPAHEQTYSGSFTYASFLVNGTNVMTKSEVLLLKRTLLNQMDEGTPYYFDIYILEVQGSRTPDVTQAGFTTRSAQELAESIVSKAVDVGHIEALIDCKVTKFGREVPEKASVVSSVDFKFCRMLPR